MTPRIRTARPLPSPLPRLRPVERRLAQACRTGGGTVDLTGSSETAVRAEVLAALLTEQAGQVRGVRLTGAVIEGALDLSGVTVGVPLFFDRCVFTDRLTLHDASLLSLRLAGSTLAGLHADGLHVRGCLDARDMVTDGGISLLGADIGGTVYLRGARLSQGGSDDAHTVNASRIRVGGHFSANDVLILGQLRMISGHVGGVVNLRRATLRRPGRACFEGERLEVDESVWFTDAVIEGRVLLTGARVGAAVDFRRARLTGPETMTTPAELAGTVLSLRASRITVGANLIVGSGMAADGAVWVDAARVGGKLSFHDAGAFGDDATVNLSGTTAHTVDLRFGQRPTRSLDLRNARVEVLVDDAEAWPQTITLDGFVYARLQADDEIPVGRRLRWLCRAPNGYRPQPYEQLMLAYRSAGQEQEARRVAYAKQVARRPQLALPGRVWNALFQATVGYGYRSWLAGLWLAGLTALGWLGFNSGDPAPHAERPQPFHALVYTVDLLLPIASLGQENAWRFSGPLAWLAWTYVLIGWFLTTAVVAGVTRAFSRT